MNGTLLKFRRAEFSATIVNNIFDAVGMKILDFIAVEFKLIKGLWFTRKNEDTLEGKERIGNLKIIVGSPCRFRSDFSAKIHVDEFQDMIGFQKSAQERKSMWFG